MNGAACAPALAVLTATITRRPEQPGLPLLPLPWVKKQVIKPGGERRVFSTALIPASLKELNRNKVCIPDWCDLQGSQLLSFVHLADVHAELGETEVEVTPVLLARQLDASDPIVLAVIEEMIWQHRQAADQGPRAYSFDIYLQVRKDILLLSHGWLASSATTCPSE